MRGPARPKVKAFGQLLFSAPHELRGVDGRTASRGPCPAEHACWSPPVLLRSHLVRDLLHPAQGLLRLQLLQGEQGQAQLVFLGRQQGRRRGRGQDAHAALPGQPQTPLCPVHWQLVCLLLGCV